MKNKFIMVNTLIVILIIIVIGSMYMASYASNKKEPDKIYSKINSEIDYLDKTLIGMVNKLNNLIIDENIKLKVDLVENTFKNNKEESKAESEENEKIKQYTTQRESSLNRKEDKIDWEYLSQETEKLFNAWMVITLDLNTMNAKKEDIETFNKVFDNLVISIKKQNKLNTGICIANLYNLIPEYVKQIVNNKQKENVYNLKANIISAYSIIDTDRFEEIDKYLKEAENNVVNIMHLSNNLSKMEQSKVNKVYVILQELKKTIKQKNLDLIYFKYITLMNEIENI